MSTRTIILAGAPDSAGLDFSERSLFPDLPVEHAPASPAEVFDQSPQPFTAQWRQLATEGLQMRPVLPRLNIKPRLSYSKELDKNPAEFFTPSEFFSGTPTSNPGGSSSDSYISTVYTDDSSSDASEFYDHSFTIHEAVPSSQLSNLTEVTPGTPTYESNDEMFPSQAPGGTGGIIRSPSQRRLSQMPRPKHLSHLADIPNADQLQSIEPQTMTVNLIVGIISISEPRTVIAGLKYGKPRETELIEVLVGDDTKSGFSITMWLPREMHVNWKDGVKATPEGSRSILRRDMKLVRPRDVVLLQNVALSSFRGKVHGQSLKKDVTKVHLLFRKKTDDEDIGGVYSVQALRNATDSDQQLLKVRRVRDFMLESVPGERKGHSQRGGRRRHLPPDTQ